MFLIWYYLALKCTMFGHFYRSFYMKNLIHPAMIMVIIVAVSSCNKNNSAPSEPSVQDSLPKIFSVYLPPVHTKIVEMFTWDKQSRLASIQAYSYDSSGGSPVLDSFLVSFTLTTNNQPPASYDEIFHLQGDAAAGESEHHLLSYDPQSRVIIDSISAATSNNFSSQHFQYDAQGNTTIQWLFGDPQTPGSYSVNQIDTMNIQNESIVTDVNYTVPDGTLNHLFKRSYSTHINPMYNTALANSLGCLMVFNNFMDFRSKYLPSKFTDQENSNPAITSNYLWTTDATGSVVKGVGSDASGSTVLEIYSFVY
jgi:hypothetical protein